MIPILYNKDETDFAHNGIGFLSDTVKATVTEERNGPYELSLQYPINGRYFSMIEDAIIKAKANDTSVPQLFRVYKSTKPINGIVTFYAEHISYDLNGLPLAGFSCAGTTPHVAINRALEETPLEHSFSAWSNISTLNSTKIKEPPSVRGLLGGQEGSILDVWGGEYEFDNFTIKLHAHRGADNGVSIEYGKNLTDIKQERNISECYTHIMPYAIYTRDNGAGEGEEIYVYLPEKVLPLPNAPNLGHYRAFRYDCSGEFDEGEIPTESKIRTLTNRYIARHDLTTPKVNITVSFVNLADTVDYKNIAPLERVRLCDTVTVKFAMLGINARAKVIKTVYNVLNEKYESVTVGDAKSNFADTVNKQSSDMAHIVSRVAQNKSRATIELENAIANATAAITGQSGGYVVLNPPEHPQEILILDAQSGGDIEQAVNVWRWNSAGLGHSSTGYDGTYTTAITYDGKIVADFIAAGTLNGELIRAGTLNANAVRVAWNDNSDYIQLENSQLNIYDATDKLISFNSGGEDIYYKGLKVGNIGSGYWNNDNTKRGIAFHLEHGSAFMSWGWKEKSTDQKYTIKWLYAAQKIPRSNGLEDYAADTLHAGCDIDLHNYNIKNVVFKDWGFSGGTISATITGYYATEYWDDGRAKTWREFSMTFIKGILQNLTY